MEKKKPFWSAAAICIAFSHVAMPEQPSSLKPYEVDRAHRAYYGGLKSKYYFAKDFFLLAKACVIAWVFQGRLKSKRFLY